MENNGKAAKQRYDMILTLLHKLKVWGKKMYCFPSQSKILEMLEEDYGVKICRRTLNYDLAKMDELGMTERVRRISYCPKRGTLFRSTLYKFGRMALWHIGRIRRMAEALVTQVRVQKAAHYPGKGTNYHSKGPQKLGDILPGLRI